MDMSQGGGHSAHAGQSHPKSQQQAPKKLRFITNQGAPHPKRRRVSSACFTCRKRKVACSGERPICQTCLQAKLDCAGYANENGNGSNVASASNANAGDNEDAATKPAKRLKTEHADSSSSDQTAAPVTQPVPQPQPVSQIPHATAASNQYPISTDQGHAQQMNTSSQLLPSIQEDHPTERSGSSSTSSLFARPRNRMPYFRYFGPTAIMPGLKQMVVKVRRQDTQTLSSQHSNEESFNSPSNPISLRHGSSSFKVTPMPVESDMRTPLALPFYDNSAMPPSELITHLCNTFFSHLGCNFPFLQRERFLKDLEEKQVDAILVDAVCALAARFSTHTMLAEQAVDGVKLQPSDYGSAFAHRAKAALTDTFATPSVAAVQTALLLAYNEFGESRDSGLWIYLGIAIRIAQDLGLQKLDGLRYEGRDGPTPKMVSAGDTGPRVMSNTGSSRQGSPSRDTKVIEEQRAVERERIDTFWAVFFVDRVVSFGTGRKSTLREKEIELSFPSLESVDAKTGWPSPFPALIRIVHLYGRVSNVLNSMREQSDISADTSKKLADMEARVTMFYQGLSPRLHFQATSFHHYVKAGEGTNFVLLHLWFHTLIVLLHQPTLLTTFDGKMLRLFPNSQQLSMSSAKTIADILSYSQLIDAKATLGNPFTTHPIYIAACAFLKETAEQTATSKDQSRTQSRVGSRANSPGRSQDQRDGERPASASGLKHVLPTPLLNEQRRAGAVEDRSMARHTLLATAASQHYQLCAKALETIETYWAGTKYILTVLEQKFKGVAEPLLYTAEEGESSLEQPKAKPAFTSPGWRRQASACTYPTSFNNLPNPFLQVKNAAQMPGSPGGDPNQAIGWTLTGTLNSPSTNLAWHYPSLDPANTSLNGVLQPYDFMTNTPSAHYDPHFEQHPQHLPRPQRGSLNDYTATPHDHFHPSNSILHDIAFPSPGMNGQSATPHSNSTFDFSPHYNYSGAAGGAVDGVAGGGGGGSSSTFGNMLIESQDVDMSLLGLDMLPWFEGSMGGDVIGMFGEGQDGEGGGGAV